MKLKKFDEEWMFSKHGIVNQQPSNHQIKKDQLPSQVKSYVILHENSNKFISFLKPEDGIFNFQGAVNLLVSLNNAQLFLSLESAKNAVDNISYSFYDNTDIKIKPGDLSIYEVNITLSNKFLYYANIDLYKPIKPTINNK
jgi:hypothetical protein